jgi:hypothetical protein
MHNIHDIKSICSQNIVLNGVSEIHNFKVINQCMNDMCHV